MLLTAVVGVVIWYQPVVKANETMRQEKLVLERRIVEATEVGKVLENKIRAMQDPRTIERLAREQLSYAKPGETVIHFEQMTTNNSRLER